MEKKQGEKQVLLFTKAESCTAIIIAVGLAAVFKGVIPFEWYLPNYYTDLINLIQNIVIMACSAISGIWTYIMKFCSSHLLPCSLIAFF